jgi:hypothetical protein
MEEQHTHERKRALTWQDVGSFLGRLCQSRRLCRLFWKTHAKKHTQKVLGFCRRCRRLWQRAPQPE